MSHEQPYYGKKIARQVEQEYIQTLLSKYRKEKVTPELHKKVYDELMNEKHLGNITIPFKVLMQKDEMGIRPDYIDVVLDSKV